MHPIGAFIVTLRPVRLGPEARWIRASEVLLYFQTDPSDAWSRITCEPINGAEDVFPEAATIFDHYFKRKLIRSWILSLQLHVVFWVKTEAKSNKLKLSMILVRKRKRANVARQFMSEQFDWLRSQMSEADQTYFISGRQTLRHLSQIRWGFYSQILGGGSQASVSSVRSEANQMQRDHKSALVYTIKRTLCTLAANHSTAGGCDC